MGKNIDGTPRKIGSGLKKELTDKDFEQILNLASHMWSRDEISAFFDICDKTLRRKIKERYDMTFEEFVSQANNVARGNLRSAM